MSKVPMKRIFIAGLKRERKLVLEALQRAGVVQIATENIKDDDLCTLNCISDKVTFDRDSNLAEQALEILSKYAPDESAGLLASLEGAKEIDLGEYEERIKNVEEPMKAAETILSLSKEIAENKAAIPRLENRLSALTPWMNLDIPLNFTGTEKTQVFIGSLKNEVDPDEIYKVLGEDLEEVRDENKVVIDVTVISKSKEMTCIMVTCLKSDAYLVENALKKVDFARAGLAGEIPAVEAEKTKAEIKACEQTIEDCIAKIKAYAPNRNDIKFAADYYQMRSAKYDVLSRLPQSENAFFIDGYVPTKYAEELKEKLTRRYKVEVELTDPGEDEDVPVMLQNNPFSDPMESVVESYSLPGKGEIDPSFIISLFYYIFFGLMLSDAGYGLLIVLGTGFALLKVKNMKPGMKKFLKLFFFSGISTTFWGFMFGSFFGDAVNVIATAFFNRPDIALRPIWFEPVSEPMRMLVFAFALGIVHLFTGLFIKGYMCLRDKDIKGFIYDVLFWAMFVGGGIVFLLTMEMITDMLGLSFRFGPTVAKAAAIAAGVGAVGIVLTGGRESKNIVKRLLKGAYSAYGVTSWLSDVLSYSRLLALGLATGVIAQVFNKMGSMLGATWYGILIFIVVFLIGHVLNLGINILGAYVHTNRLQFVEFFGKFYEGGGKEYQPFTEKTKYYNVTEAKIKEEK
ncbi:MAG: V-type ATP synthase subunit I [Eubacteriales bacterium]|nr:V-type ATP synthase subunit I [Eubacteriales bacterium]